MKNQKKSNRGFTIIELICCIAILAILIAMALPAFGNIKAKAEQRAFDNNVRTLRMAAIQFTMDYPHTATIWSAFAGQKPNPETEITDRNLFESWQKYLPEYPHDPTRAPGSTFVVEVDEHENITITPSEYGN